MITRLLGIIWLVQNNSVLYLILVYELKCWTFVQYFNKKKQNGFIVTKHKPYLSIAVPFCIIHTSAYVRAIREIATITKYHVCRMRNSRIIMSVKQQGVYLASTISLFFYKSKKVKTIKCINRYHVYRKRNININIKS